jgi:hypothetical protein
MIFGEVVRDYVIRQAASWNRFNFFWATFRFKPRSDTLDANSGSRTPSTIPSASNLINYEVNRRWQIY